MTAVRSSYVNTTHSGKHLRLDVTWLVAAQQTQLGACTQLTTGLTAIQSPATP
jgi:hypothetical protein